MPQRTFTFAPTPFAKNDIVLGSLIPDKRYPDQDALIKYNVRKEDCTRVVDRNFDSHIHSTSDSSFKTALTKIFTATFSLSSADDVQFSSSYARLYMLRNPRAVFKSLCEDSEVQQWLEEIYETGEDAYFIIGYRTLLNAKVVDQSSKLRKAQGGVDVPLGAATGLEATAPGQLDIAAEANHSHSEHRGEDYESLGERVYAVCCKKVKLKVEKGLFDSAKLDVDPKWRSFASRGLKSGGKPGEVALTVASIDEESELDETGTVLERLIVEDETDVFEIPITDS